MPRLWPLNDFGVEVQTFCAKTGWKLTEICKACDVRYETLRGAMAGRTAGHEIKPKVREFIEENTQAD